MLKIVAIMFCGIAVGVALRHRRLTVLPHLITLLVWLLLFLLGIEAGRNPRVIAGLRELGIEALMLCLAGVAGSVALAWVLWRFSQGRKEGRDEG